MYINLTRKTFINLSLLLILPHIFARFRIPYKIRAVILIVVPCISYPQSSFTNKYNIY